MEPRRPERTPSTRGEHSINTFISGLRNCKIKEVFTWHLLKIMAMGQGLSVFICGTAVSSQYLAVDFHVNTPMLQSFMNYALLCLMYTSTLAFTKGDGNILQILKTKWWKYLLLGFTDVEANYAVVTAYQFTTLTSIQLLDCFVIPVLMVLSWFFLKTRYHAVHYVAVCICLLGVGTMVGADLIAGRDQGSTSNVLLGDGLVLVSATLYAISNVCQEYTVKNCSRVEFLGMVGLFGTLISGIQMAALEHRNVAEIAWDWKIGLLFAAYALCMCALYSFMPMVVKMSSATAVNLSLLTADLFSLFCGVFLFHYIFSGLYVVSFLVITVGFVMFNAVPTFTLASAPTQDNTGGLTNPAFDTVHDLGQEGRKVEEQEEEETAKREHPDMSLQSQVPNPTAQTAEYSTNM
ncbi:hypothetical protein AGOR_G00128730 [Albula goreensis]|uniref:Solute carrier family 35 member F2 n=1 Tax=Albula goreensis TaxID=1534307 RepID=A0A8T3DB06_9TELE|nr:hypothetical protein AGOR_G00128730 [Albula goreensis]